METPGENKVLTEIVTEPERAAQVSVEQIPMLLVRLASVQAILLSRLAVSPNGQPSAPTPDDRFLNVDEAAQILNVTPRWLYRHAKDLPFVHRLNRKTLRFSETRLRRWAAAHRP